MALNNVYMHKRELGIDLFKVFAMFLVVVVHVFWHGMREMAEAWNFKISMPCTATEYALFALRVFACCCINCFALATGYIAVKNTYKWQRIIVLWLQTVVLGLVCVSVFKLLSLYTGMQISSRYFGDAFKPVSCATYWYFTAYVGLFAIMPFINAALAALNHKQLTCSVVVILGVFSLLPTVIGQDLFDTMLGFSAWWLAICYILGAYVRLTDLPTRVSAKVVSFVIVGMWMFTAGISLVMLKHKHIFLNYISLNVIIMSVAWLVLFAKIRSENRFVVWLAKLSPYTFGVYLIHENPFVKGELLNRFLWIRSLNPVLSIVSVLVISAAIFLISASIDYLRARLFEILKVRQGVDKLAGKVNAMIDAGASKSER